MPVPGNGKDVSERKNSIGSVQSRLGMVEQEMEEIFRHSD